MNNASSGHSKFAGKKILVVNIAQRQTTTRVTAFNRSATYLQLKFWVLKYSAQYLYSHCDMKSSSFLEDQVVAVTCRLYSIYIKFEE